MNFSFANKTTVDKIAGIEGNPKKNIQGIAWYNILSNPAYVSEFNYISASIDCREKLINDDDNDEDNDREQVDMISLLINLAYVRLEVAQEFQCKRGFSAKYNENMERAGTLEENLVRRKSLLQPNTKVFSDGGFFSARDSNYPGYSTQK